MVNVGYSPTFVGAENPEKVRFHSFSSASTAGLGASCACACVFFVSI
ncbi:MAG: hypothetical protein ACK55Z_17545, partial [bacterium]